MTLTRLEIAFTINKFSQFLATPSILRWQACKQLLTYLQCKTDYGLQFYNSGSHTLTAFSDADWGSDLDDRKSLGGYCVYLENDLISWSSKKQNTVSRSTVESEYRALVFAASEVLWITYLLNELKLSLLHIPVLRMITKVHRHWQAIPSITPKLNTLNSICSLSENMWLEMNYRLLMFLAIIK